MRLPLALLVAAAFGSSAVGCCSRPDPRVTELRRLEIASLGSAAKIGLSVNDLRDLDDAVGKGDRSAVQRIASRGLRTDSELARIDSNVKTAQRHVDEDAAR